MRTLLKTAGAVAATTTLLAVPLSASADTARPRPISGQVVGFDSIDLAAPGCTVVPGTPTGSYWRYSSEGTGRLSHLGRVSFKVSHCSFMTSATDGSFGQGGSVVTAANGDTLTLQHWGTFELVVGQSEVDLSWKVIDGTGRFEDATGSGTAVGYSDLAAGTTTMDYKGKITYDASQRP